MSENRNKCVNKQIKSKTDVECKTIGHTFENISNTEPIVVSNAANADRSIDRNIDRSIDRSFDTSSIVVVDEISMGMKPCETDETVIASSSNDNSKDKPFDLSVQSGRPLKSNLLRYQEFRSMITVDSVSPNAFDGTSDIDDWIEHFISVSKCNNWNEIMQMSRLPVSLKGTAEVWYRQFVKLDETLDCSLRNRFSLLELFEGLRNAFRPRNYRSINHSMLSKRHQNANESVTSYYFDILRLCDKYNFKMEDNEKIIYVMRGLKRELLEKILIVEPKSCIELLNKLKIIEESIYLTSRLHENKHNVETDEKDGNLSGELSNKLDRVIELNENLSKSLSQFYQVRWTTRRGNRMTRTEDGQPICHRCHTPGHIVKSCTRKDLVTSIAVDPMMDFRVHRTDSK